MCINEQLPRVSAWLHKSPFQSSEGTRQGLSWHIIGDRNIHVITGSLKSG